MLGLFIQMRDNSCFCNLSGGSSPTLSLDQIHFDMEEKILTLEHEAKIQETALNIKEEKKLRKVYPIVVSGETECGEKESSDAFLTDPTFPQFSQFTPAS